MVMSVEAFLEHHGVKGMRWGVRKDRGGSSKSKGAPSRPKAHELSDEDLRKAIERMNLEQQYSVLAGHTTTKKGGKDEASAFIADLGKGLARQAVNAAGQQAINAALKK